MKNIYASDILLFYRISYLTASYILFGKHFFHSQSKCLPHPPTANRYVGFEESVPFLYPNVTLIGCGNVLSIGSAFFTIVSVRTFLKPQDPKKAFVSLYAASDATSDN